MRPAFELIVLASLLVPVLAVEAVRLRLEPSAYEGCAGSPVTLNLTLENPTGDQQLYTLALDAPAGVTPPSTRTRRSVGQGNRLDVSWTVELPASAPEGTHRIAVRAMVGTDTLTAASVEGTLRVARCAPAPVEAGEGEAPPAPPGVMPGAALAAAAALALAALAVASRRRQPSPPPAQVPSPGEMAPAYAQAAYYAPYQPSGSSYYYYRYAAQQPYQGSAGGPAAPLDVTGQHP